MGPGKEAIRLASSGGALKTEAVLIFPQEPSLYTVKAILILDNDGDRLFAKVRFPFKSIMILKILPSYLDHSR